MHTGWHLISAVALDSIDSRRIGALCYFSQMHRGPLLAERRITALPLHDVTTMYPIIYCYANNVDMTLSIDDVLNAEVSSGGPCNRLSCNMPYVI